MYLDDMNTMTPVSYTHLDVYKRQIKNQRAFLPKQSGKQSLYLNIEIKISCQQPRG